MEKRKEMFCGIDLHSNNSYVGIVDGQGRRVFDRRVPNDLKEVLGVLAGYREDLAAVAVESTYHWYWLVDGLMEAGYPVALAHPSAMGQYAGLKNVNDQTEAYFLAELLRLGILPTGYIYPKSERPVRDLLRRRTLLVRQKTTQMLSFQSLLARERGVVVNANEVRKMGPLKREELLREEHLVLAGQTNLSVIQFLASRIRTLEKAVRKRIRLKPQYELLLTVPGIGRILALTIMVETGDIGRFAQVGDYSSYCRCVKADRLSNGKGKGKNNRKNGNRYLAWAYIEAAQFARRYGPAAQAYYQRKRGKTHVFVAGKALANKLCKACYFILKNQEPFDVQRGFGVRPVAAANP